MDAVRVLMSELIVIRQAAFWAVGVVLGLLAISYVLKAVGLGDRISLSPEALVGGGE